MLTFLVYDVISLLLLNPFLAEVLNVRRMSNHTYCKAHCLPIILYSSECFEFTMTQKREVNSWCHSIYMKILRYHKVDSVRQLICLLQRLDCLSLLEFRTFCFTNMLMGSESTVIRSMLYSYKLSKECANFELKMSRALMKCKLYDKLDSII